jgi:phosphate:Na+ symporter
MDFFALVNLFGGLALFLYGMSALSNGLERLSDGRLEKMLEKMTGSVLSGVLLGTVLTGAIQSSSATTVILVGLVNARMMKLHQAIGVIMGANIGTTVTAHILRLTDLESGNFFLRLFKPSTLSPLAAIAGIILMMVCKKTSRKNVGQMLLGFAVLFTGLFAMESAVAPLRELPLFTQLFSTLKNPILGVLVGAGVTAVIQSSSASVGILQALSSTGQITFASAIPIILGQNIGTCVTPLMASVGASKNARRTALVHLFFNVIGTAVFLIALYSYQYAVGIPFWNTTVDKGGIANFHTIFNVTVTLLFLPGAAFLEKLVCKLIQAAPTTWKSPM